MYASSLAQAGGSFPDGVGIRLRLHLQEWGASALERFSATPARECRPKYYVVFMQLLLLILVLLILFGGGGYYLGGPAYGGGGLGLVLLIVLIIFLMGG